MTVYAFTALLLIGALYGGFALGYWIRGQQERDIDEQT